MANPVDDLGGVSQHSLWPNFDFWKIPRQSVSRGECLLDLTDIRPNSLKGS
jgi:uncharacterized protein YbdZ (MbtH family)